MAVKYMNYLKLKTEYIIISFFVIICSMNFLIYSKELEKNSSLPVSSTEQEILLPVIMYHNISEKPNHINRYCVSLKNFENDLKYIKSKGYNCITTQELINYVNKGVPLPEKPFMITFDDGYESFYKYAYPLLKKYDMKAVMSIVGSYTDLFTNEEDHNVDYSHLNWKEVNELNNCGFIEIQNHTYNLHEITKTRKGAGKAKGESFEHFKKVFKTDVEKLNTMILNYTGKKSNVFTYPYGNIAEKSVDIIKEIGFDAALTCTEQINVITKNPEDLYSICRFNREGKMTTEQFFNHMENAKIAKK